MYEQYLKRQRTRKNAYTRAQGILNQMGYTRLAHAEHRLDAIGKYYDSLCDDLQEFGLEKGTLSEEYFFGMLAKLAYVADEATDVINMLFEASGASAVADFNPMQRYWRDGNTVRLHQGMDYDVASQSHGRSLIGLPPTPDL
jgi:alkylation response protein AidB-like acyl-CoA dehydrogenase